MHICRNMAFRSPTNVERYEDVVFDLETALITVVANNAHQRKTVTVLWQIIVEKLRLLTGMQHGRFNGESKWHSSL